MLISALSLISFITKAQNTTFTIGTEAIGLYTDDEASLSTRSFTLGLENTFGKRWAISVDLSTGKKQQSTINTVGLKQKLSSLKTGLKFYPKKGQRGFFFGYNFVYTNVETVLSNEDSVILPFVGGKFIGTGTEMGFNTRLGERLTFGTVAGLNLMVNTNDIESPALQYNIGAKIGYRF